jgi:hypothetical protein
MTATVEAFLPAVLRDWRGFFWRQRGRVADRVTVFVDYQNARG